MNTHQSGFIEVDARLRTTASQVFAVGDVTGAMASTQVAAYHARVATVNALFGTRRASITPRCQRVRFTDPEVAAVGLTESEARARWEKPTIVSFDYAELDRAITDGRPYGFVTLVGDPHGRLVGVTIAYPTLSEGPSRAADAHLRARFAGPRTQRLAGRTLRILCHLDHAR